MRRFSWNSRATSGFTSAGLRMLGFVMAAMLLAAVVNGFCFKASTTHPITKIKIVNSRHDNHCEDDGNPQSSTSTLSSSRRSAIAIVMTTLGMMTPYPAWAAADCFKDCIKNCKIIAPKDPGYCNSNCKEYCDQDDRNDGLSGSVSASAGYVGVLGGTWGQGTVTNAEDRPPSVKLPGLDFGSESGRQLIGY